MVKVFKNKDDHSTPLVGQVHDLTRAGIIVHLTDGRFMLAHPDQVEEEHAVARLNKLPSRDQVARSAKLSPEHFHPDEGRAIVNNPKHPAHERAVESLTRSLGTPSSLHPDVHLHGVWQVHHHEVPVKLSDGTTIKVDRRVAPLVKEVNDAGLSTRFSAATEEADTSRFRGDAQLFFDGKSADAFLARLPAGKYKVHESTGEGQASAPKPGEIVVSRQPNLRGGEIVLLNQADLPGITKDFKASAPIKILTPPKNMRPATAEDRARLKIPPGWKNVHVANDPTTDMQAWGQDAKGRRQYRYTDEYHARQADKKFARIRELHGDIPQLEAALERDAPNDGTAACVLLIRRMGIRNGSDTDTGADKFAYGASNLRAKHIKVQGDKVTLDFIGKEGVHQVHEVTDPKLKQILRDRVNGLGPEDKVFATNENKTLAYLQRVTGKPYKVHDLRTYLANQTALQAMEGFNPPETLAEYRALRLQVAKLVSEVLGNKPQQALASYINPAVFAKWQKDPSWSK